MLVAALALPFACDTPAPKDDPAPFSALFHADQLGEAAALQVLILPPDTRLLDDPEAVVAAGQTEASFELPEGDWSAQAGESYGSSGAFDGQVFHVEEDGDYWIAPPLDVHATPGGSLEHTFELNFLVTGWWECCTSSPSGATVCGMNEVDYHEGHLADLPGLGLVEVAGMTLSGTLENGSVIDGAFVDSRSAYANVTETNGETHEYRCCEGSCE